MNRTSRILSATLSAGLAVAAVGACSSSGKSGGGSTSAGSTSSSTSSSATFTGAPIKVLTMAPTGTQIFNVDTATVAKAFAAKVNSQGGINGHELQITACNEKFDPNQAAACARQAVSEKAVAVVGGFTSFGDQVMPILQAAGIPDIGNQAASADELSSKLSFPLAAGPLGIADLGAVASKSCTKIGTVLLDNPTLLGLLPLVKKSLGSKKIAGTIKVPQTTVDFSSAAKAMGAYDCALVVMSSSQVSALVASKAQLGVKTRVFVLGASVDQSLLTKFGSDLEGSQTLSSFPGLKDPAWAAALAALPKGFDFSNENLQNTWASLVVLQNALKGVSGDITAASMLKALNGATALSTGGLTPTLNLASPLPVPSLARILNPSVINFEISKGQLVQQGTFLDLRAALS